MNALHRARLDKTAFSVASLADESDEKSIGWQKVRMSRRARLELMRHIVYGHDPSTERLQRILEVAECPSN